MKSGMGRKKVIKFQILLNFILRGEFMNRLNHTKNFMVRLLFFVILYVTYEQLLKAFSFSIMRVSYLVFFAIFSVNYLFDNLNFRGSRYKVSNLIYSIVINFIIFLLYAFIAKNTEILIVGILFTTIQNLYSYVAIKLVAKNKNVVIFGSGEELEELIEKVKKYEGYSYLGFIDDSEKSLGSKRNVYNIAKENNSELIILLNEPEQDLVSNILRLKIKGIEILTFLEFVEMIEGKIDLRKLSERWVLRSDGFNILNNSYSQRIKRMWDIIGTFIIGILALPLIIVATIIVKITSKGPIIFSQDRIGIAGEKFKIYKFRSMYLHDENQHSKYAGENDSRITPFGKFMRKTRVDELPQLWNVLNGDMSFVGPRAEWDKLHEEYEKEIPLYYLRASIKPGLTGWAQVKYPYGANLEDTKRKLEYDIYYMKYQNFMMDLIIIMKTIKIVLFGKGM